MFMEAMPAGPRVATMSTDAPYHRRAAIGLAERASLEARRRVGLMLTDMDLVDPDRPRLAPSFDAEIDAVMAQADETYWRPIVIGIAPEVLGHGAAGGEYHPAVALAEAMLAQSASGGGGRG
jgi:hypothetical protein